MEVWSIAGAFVDVIHAALMVAWLLGLPLLFVRRFPRMRRAYCVYAIGFVAASQASQALLGECFLTALARNFWLNVPASLGSAPTSGEWFTVRLAQAVFRLTPTHRSIKLVSEALIVLTAAGSLVAFRRDHRDPHAGMSGRAATRT